MVKKKYNIDKIFQLIILLIVVDYDVGRLHMKDIACMALTEGMVIAKDVLNFQNDVIVKAGTTVSTYTIQKLSRYNIMLVTIMEEVDFAETYFEKIRLSEDFKKFEKAYTTTMILFKTIMNDIAERRTQVPYETLRKLYYDVYGSVADKEKILDYLYNMLPTEDDLTYAHCYNSALIAGVFGHWLNLNPEEMIILVVGSCLYDIGKLKLPHDLIWKSGKLTPIEFERIKTHTFLGFQILQDMPLDENILKATLSHHERYDGSGYPSRLHDVQINKYARIIAIIDSYEAMTSARTYRASKHPFQVIEIFEQDAVKYDMEILTPIMTHLANHMVGLKVKLDNDVTAEVIMINSADISRPLLRDDNGTFIDLFSRRELKITGIY